MGDRYGHFTYCELGTELCYGKRDSGNAHTNRARRTRPAHVKLFESDCWRWCMGNGENVTAVCISQIRLKSRDFRREMYSESRWRVVVVIVLFAEDINFLWRFTTKISFRQLVTVLFSIERKTSSVVQKFSFKCDLNHTKLFYANQSKPYSLRSVHLIYYKWLPILNI